MNKEEKELLLSDLSARVPYGIKAVLSEKMPEWFIDRYGSCEDSKTVFTLDTETIGYIIRYLPQVKPYLRSMESMTEVEHAELSKKINDDTLLTGNPSKTIALHCGVVIDFMYSHHLDWRGLIGKGLALEAPMGMYKEKD